MTVQTTTKPSTKTKAYASSAIEDRQLHHQTSCSLVTSLLPDCCSPSKTRNTIQCRSKNTLHAHRQRHRQRECSRRATVGRRAHLSCCTSVRRCLPPLMDQPSFTFLPSQRTGPPGSPPRPCDGAPPPSTLSHCSDGAPQVSGSQNAVLGTTGVEIRSVEIRSATQVSQTQRGRSKQDMSSRVSRTNFKLLNRGEAHSFCSRMSSSGGLGKLSVSQNIPFRCIVCRVDMCQRAQSKGSVDLTHQHAITC